MAALIGLMTDPKNTSEQVAKEFLILHSTPQEREFADYYQKFTTGQVNERDLNHYVGLMKKEYGPLMSQAAFDKAMANRFIPWHDLIIQDEDYYIFIDSIELGDKEVYGDAREHYNFSISLQVEFSTRPRRQLL